MRNDTIYLLQCVFFIIAIFLSLFIATTFSRKARERYECLRWADGKKHIFLLVIFLFYVLAYFFQWKSYSVEQKISDKKVSDQNAKIVNLKNTIGNMNKKAALSGELKSLNKNESNEVTIILGSNRFAQSISRVNYGRYFKLGGFFPPSSVYVKVQNGKIFLKAQVSTLDGHILADIVDNQWDINSHNSRYFRRNYNDGAVEVITADGIPVLQVELLDESTIKIGGVFIGEKCSEVIYERTLSKFCGPDNKEDVISQAAKRINKIFKYPSDLNQGVRE